MEKIKVHRWKDYYANYDVKYMVEVSHTGLHEHRVLTDRDDEILENKIRNLCERWDKKWQAILEKEEKAKLINDLKERASYQTREAESYINLIENILRHTLEIDDTIDWSTLKDKSTFPEKKPIEPTQEILEAPKQNESKYQPDFDFLDKIFKKRKQKKIDLFEKKYQDDYQRYLEKQEKLDQEFVVAKEEHEKALKLWLARKAEFYERMDKSNQKVDDLKKRYLEIDVNAVEEYCDLVLSNSEYPSSFPQSFELEYKPDNKSLVIDYWLPVPDDMPSVKEVKFIASRKELKEIAVSEVQRKKYYDSVIYQIALRTLHELFEADVANALDLITFNGWVSFINKSNGQNENSCIISIQTNKSEFESINLEYVDPKECFKGLKGVGSSKLYGLTPVKPILKLDKNDSRITSHYDVAHTLDESVNLAAMDWEEFEHLVRELFSKEFSINGGEVKVTQASRDGGVDAIAFDPDPIRGGKIVIQAKRYTNTVGVSAVRDLFGTIVNEGANKGILVTTANYGPDAYTFAKGKPITLLNGSNLLHLLAKHGYSARINVKEAKKK